MKLSIYLHNSIYNKLCEYGSISDTVNRILYCATNVDNEHYQSLQHCKGWAWPRRDLGEDLCKRHSITINCIDTLEKSNISATNLIYYVVENGMCDALLSNLKKTTRSKEYKLESILYDLTKYRVDYSSVMFYDDLKCLDIAIRQLRTVVEGGNYET